MIASSYAPRGPDLPSAQDGSSDDQVADDDAKATSAGTIRQVMTLRTDLGGSVVSVDRPFFLQLRDSTDSAANGTLNATEVLKIAGARSADVDARTFEAGKLMTSWSPTDTDDGVEGLLVRSGSAYFEIDGESTILIMVIISAPGSYSVSVNATEAANGTPLAPPVTMDITVQAAASQYLFNEPEIQTEYTGDWMSFVSNSSSMTFSIGAKTTDLWKATETYPTLYNWTVTIINPDHMTSDDDLARYNTGDPTLDPANLVNTSVDSTWSWGVGSPLHVIWGPADGVRLEGSAVTTPTTKELTQGGTRAAWLDGSWEAYGDGEMNFHQSGHYIFLFTLTKNGQAVSAPLVVETVVS
jgi:hypothetical protein